MARKNEVWEVENHSPTLYPEIEGWNEELVETAGFVPLEVRFKQMEQAGYRAQFFESEFSSKDVSDMYLNHPEFDITSEDDIEEAYEKMQLRNAWIQHVKDEAKKRMSLSKNEAEETDLKERSEKKESSSANEES